MRYGDLGTKWCGNSCIDRRHSRAGSASSGARGIKAFWDDGGEGPTSDHAREVNLREAGLILSNGRGVRDNFFGLIDDRGRTIQFYFESSIPDGVDDARRLPIILMNFPYPELNGSHGRRVTIREVDGLIETAFRTGADHHEFGALTFTPW